MRFHAVGFSTILFLLAVVGGVGVAPVVDAAAADAPQAAAPAAEKEKPKDDKSEVEEIQWPEKYDPRTLKPIRLFMTRKEVREMWGEPAKSFSPSFEEKDFPSTELYEYAVNINFLLKDVYYRKAVKNSYEIQVIYGLYRSKEKPRPEVRVISVNLVVGNPVPTHPTLKDLSEASDFCRSDCGMYVWEDTRHRLWVDVYPRNPNPNERKTAESIAIVRSGFEYYKKITEQDNWLQVIRLHLIKPPRYFEDGVSASDFELLTYLVEEVSITVDTPESFLRSGAGRAVEDYDSYIP